jgi:hypothetical protein
MKTTVKGEAQSDLPFGTRHGLDPLVCLSALQKCIRRGLEREAMEFACELLNTPEKRFCTMVTNRLQIISHEDMRVPPRWPGPKRVHHEHRVVWVQRREHGFWRSRTSNGHRFHDEDCVGWKCLEDE